MAPCARRVASLRLAGESTCDLMMLKTLLAIELAFPRYDVSFVVIVPIRYFALRGDLSRRGPPLCQEPSYTAARSRATRT